MSLLLDTHVAIWATREPERLSSSVKDTLFANAGSIFVSAAAIWELAIKYPLGRAAKPPFTAQDAIFEFQAAGFSLLNVKPAHAAFVERLPPVHADPFDRLMISQSIVEGMQLVTYDRNLARYDIGILT